MSHEAERTAVEQLFLKVTLPIIVQDKGRFGIVGTATLFTIQDRPSNRGSNLHTWRTPSPPSEK